MMRLMQENVENRQRMLLSILCGSITIVAVLALVAIAAFLEIPAAVRILLLFVALITGVAGVVAAAILDRRAGYFECPHCKAMFVPSWSAYVKGYHTLTKRRLTCPECGQTGMCKHRIVRR